MADMQPDVSEYTCLIILARVPCLSGLQGFRAPILDETGMCLKAAVHVATERLLLRLPSPACLFGNWTFSKAPVKLQRPVEEAHSQMPVLLREEMVAERFLGWLLDTYPLA